MCDAFARKPDCYERTGRWLKPLKLSRWELPIPSSKPYWTGVFSEIEKKHKKVRFPHPFISISKSTVVRLKTQISDDIKFKISPPTPRHKTSESNDLNDESLLINSTEKNNKNEKKFKVFTKKSCPYHFAIKFPMITKKNKVSSCEHRVVRENEETALKPRAIAKAPKLKAASLLPSFAKPVSTDSSISIESEEEDNNNSSKSETIKRDYLRVPNLRFVSAHPSFRKLSFADDDDIDDYVDASNVVLVGEIKDTISEREIKSVRGKSKDYEKKFIYEALDVLTKNKHSEITKKLRAIDDKACKESTVEPVLPTIKNKNIKYEDDDEQIPFIEVQKSLKINNLNLIRDEPKNLAELRTRTIRSSSRSTSGPSLDFQANQETITNLTIPNAKLYPRAYYDKCYACLYKPFERSTIKRRELPIAKLKSYLDEPPIFRTVNSNSSSSSNSLTSIDFVDDVKINLPEQKEDQHDISTATSNEPKNKDDHPKVSFDTSLLMSPKDTSSPSSTSTSRSERHHRYHHSQSKTSSPSNQSSDSDDNRVLEDKLPTSKYTAPCHAPVVWRPSLEPLKALRLKKATSIRARTAALIAKPSEGSDDSDSEVDETKDKKKQEQVDANKESGDANKEDEEAKTKTKKKKQLVRMKTATEQMIVPMLPVDEAADDTQTKDVKAVKLLKRAKTTFDLTRAKSDDSLSSSSEESDVEKKIDVPIDVTKDEQQQLPYYDVILRNMADSPAPPIMTTDDALDIIKKCLQDGFNANDLLDKLAKEFVKRLEDRCKTNGDSLKYSKLGLNLFRVLIDSRRYLKPSTFPSDLEFPIRKQSSQATSSQLKYLPPESRDLVANVLGIPRQQRNDADDDDVDDRDDAYSESEDSMKSFGMTVHPPTSARSLDADNSSYQELINPYAAFLKKPRRKAVVWRALRDEDLKGYDPEATLEMRAARLLDRICREFCEWLKQLGGDEQIIDEDTLKDMFEINFTADACKSMQVILKEMPTVPLAVANARRCKDAGSLEATRKQIQRDLKVEGQPKRTYAFGRALPTDLRFVPPKGGRLSAKWLECDYIPSDLDNMDVVWNGIMHLDSVQAFLRYLEDDPRENNPELLKNLTGRKVNIKD